MAYYRTGGGNGGSGTEILKSGRFSQAVSANTEYTIATVDNVKSVDFSTTGSNIFSTTYPNSAVKIYRDGILTDTIKYADLSNSAWLKNYDSAATTKLTVTFVRSGTGSGTCNIHYAVMATQ